eukprot:sb/3476411/
MGDNAIKRIKLLEDLQSKKMQLQSKIENNNGVGSHPQQQPAVIPQPTVPEPIERTPAEASRLHASKLKALQGSNQDSDGFFVTQDSIFGNLILSVIPRFNADGSLGAGNLPRTGGGR